MEAIRLRKYGFGLLAVLALAVIALGCATIISGKRQKIDISSVPLGATVSVDGEERGKTPLITKVRRKGKTHTIRIELDGYEPYTVTLHRKFNAWYIGNLVFGGIIGFIVDPITGAMYKMDTKQVEAQLQRRDAQLLEEEDTIYVGMSSNPDPTWEKIADLKPVGSN